MKQVAGTKVAIGPSRFAVGDGTPLEILRSEGCEVIPNPQGRKLSKDEIMELLSSGAEGLIAGLEPLDRDVLRRSRLAVVSRCGSGLDNVDLEAAKALDIQVFSTPEGPTQAVAELTLAAMLSLLRRLPHMNDAMHDGRWVKEIGNDLAGKTVAIVGYGRIGRRLRRLLAPFDVRVLAVDPALAEADPTVTVLSLDAALQQADIITLHCSGDACVIGRRELGLVKHGAYLLNAARGALVAEPALIEALEEGSIAGAWLDAFDSEPYDGHLSRFPQVLLTPHVGSYTSECRRQMETQAVHNLVTGLRQRTER